MLFDAHIHNKNHEDGGLLIGLEGEPSFDGVLSNEEVLRLHDPEKNYYSFVYVSFENVDNIIGHPYLKYHPRREKYTSYQVKLSIQKNSPKAVILDTLNEPYWKAYDYWEIARENPNTPMIFAHSGGYLINEFIKICHFQQNVWIDFALTHTILGHYGDRNKGLPYIDEAIKYSLNSVFKDRILMSSDYPFFNQDDVFDYYQDYHDLLNNNYMNFTKIIQ